MNSEDRGQKTGIKKLCLKQDGVTEKEISGLNEQIEQLMSEQKERRKNEQMSGENG